MSASEKPTAQGLEKIAETLGIGVDDFFCSTPNADKFAQDVELVKLWQLLRTVEAREQVLDYIRRLLK